VEGRKASSPLTLWGVKGTMETEAVLLVTSHEFAAGQRQMKTPDASRVSNNINIDVA